MTTSTRNAIRVLALCFCFFGCTSVLFAQEFVPNYDEEKVPAYTLPDPLKFEDGSAVANASAWQLRRSELLKAFSQEVYGFAPEWNGTLSSELLWFDDQALDGLADAKEVRITLQYDGREMSFNLLMYMPKGEGTHPVFVGLNFFGNHTTTDNPKVVVPDAWSRNRETWRVSDNKPTADSRGLGASRWPYKEVVERGYAVATVFCNEIDPDVDHGFQYGVHALMNVSRHDASWGTLAAWAWGLSRVADYFETDYAVDASKIVVLGHSRLGKAAMWAGAVDERFAMVISNNSGCGGAAISRRQYGETVERINNNFPYWFNGRFKAYSRQEYLLPVDQHQLIALMAPRPVYVASAEEDRWADPKGEFLACVAATPVYQLLGKPGIEADMMPDLNQPLLQGFIGYHIRPGRHDITLYDWMRYVDFADRHFR